MPAVKQASLAETTVKETIYWHYEQRPEPAAVLAVRTVVPPSQITGAVSAAVAMLDPEVAISDARLLDDRVEGSLGPQRTPMVLTLVFAGVAFALAVIGIYGVLAWAVAPARQRDRRAHGARRARDRHRPHDPGAGRQARSRSVSSSASRAHSRSAACCRRSSIGVGSFDPAVLAITVVGLGGAALVASWLPARRAARVDPMQALRSE